MQSSAIKPNLPIRVLVDTNVLIFAEDAGDGHDLRSEAAAKVLKFASELRVSIVASHATHQDFTRANGQLRSRRLAQMEKYNVLSRLQLDLDLAARAGYILPLSPNDRADFEVIQALSNNAADWIVTEDRGIHRRAARLGFEAKVFDLAAAVEAFSAYLVESVEVTGVHLGKGYQIPLHARIFESIRDDYTDFDDWWKAKVALGHRDVLVIGEFVEPEALLVLKIEQDKPHDIDGRLIKFCTFKVDNMFEGYRKGELLLQAGVSFARKNQAETVYVEILSDKEYLQNWLEGFGFTIRNGAVTPRGERVFVKRLLPDERHTASTPLSHNILFGPGAVVLQSPHIVPVNRKYSRRLFPQVGPQMPLWKAGEACSNAIRKAYLCNANTRLVREGDTLLFLQTGGQSAVIAVGVVEAVLVSKQPAEIVSFVGNRTVYSVAEINDLCAVRPVLALRFRMDRVLNPVWSTVELQEADVMAGSVQSIRRVKKEGIPWVQQRLAGSL